MPRESKLFILDLMNSVGYNAGVPNPGHTRGGEQQVREQSFICIYSRSPSLALLPQLCQINGDITFS